MQDRVPASLARELTVAFYRSLLEQGLVDVALNAARLYLYEGADVDWAIPVLFSRLPDGRLFVPGEVAGAAVTRKVVLRQTEHGVRADRHRADRPVRSLPVRALPRDFPDLLGREDEVQAAATALQAGGTVEIVGGVGIGKTALLRHLVHRVAGPDGAVHGSARGRTVEDLLQYMFDRVYRTEGSYRPTPGELRDALADVRVLFALDDVELSREDVGRLMDGAPTAVFLLAGPGPTLGGGGESIRLAGLPAAAAMTLFERHLGRPLTQEEAADAPALVDALSGRPQELIQAAARVRDDGVPLGQVVSEAAAAGGPPGGAVIGTVNLSSLPEVDRRVLGILAAVGTAPVRPEHLEALTGERDLDEVLERLRRRGLIKAASPAFTLAQGIGPEAERFLQVDTWRERVLERFLEWGGQNRDDTGRLLRSLDAILASLEWAWAAARRRDYLALARVVEEPLLVSRRWGTWLSILRRSLEAAETLGGEIGPHLQAHAHHALGTRALGEGDTRVARQDLRRALKLRESIGDVEGAALTRHNLRLAQPFYQRWRPNRSLIVGTVAGLLALGVWQAVAGGGALSVDPGELSFPGIEVGTSSIEQTVQVTNGEDAAIRIGDVRIGGADADQFVVSQEGCEDRELGPGRSCPIRIRFHPTVGGPRSATLAVATGAGEEATVDLTGTGAVTASLRRPRPVEEGDEGDARTATFTISLSAESTDEVSVDYETQEGTASAGDDFEEGSETLTFEPGTIEMTVSVPIVGDLLDEPNREAFSLELTEVHGHDVEGVRAEAIIEDDDPPPSISVVPSSVDEGDEGSIEMTFQAVLSEESGRQVRATIATSDRTATAGQDYRVLTEPLTLIWEPGETEMSFVVEVLGDVLDEADQETFSLQLSDFQHAQKAENEEGFIATIVDDDNSPTLSIIDAPEVLEPDPPTSAVFEIRLSEVSGRDVTVRTTTMDDPSLDCPPDEVGRATAGVDYSPVDDTVTIFAGESQAAVVVAILDDEDGDECRTEGFLVVLSDAVNASIEEERAVGTIVDDDGVD
jgi:hypothetical protein